jgi:hypothetical protein
MGNEDDEALRALEFNQSCLVSFLDIATVYFLVSRALIFVVYMHIDSKISSAPSCVVLAN